MKKLLIIFLLLSASFSWAQTITGKTIGSLDCILTEDKVCLLLPDNDYFHKSHIYIQLDVNSEITETIEDLKKALLQMEDKEAESSWQVHKKKKGDDITDDICMCIIKPSGSKKLKISIDKYRTEGYAELTASEIQLLIDWLSSCKIK